MTDTTRPAQPRMPSIGRLLAAQIGYQARLLASGRAITIGVGFPVILLIASHQSHTHTTAADVAQYAVFGLTLTAWNTYGVRLVAAREAGVLKRWRATPLPRWCYFLGRILATVVVATVAGAATVAAGVLLYNTHLTVSGALGALVVFVLGVVRLGRRRHRPHRRHPHPRGGRADASCSSTSPSSSSRASSARSANRTGCPPSPATCPPNPSPTPLGIALGHTAGHTWLPARDLVVLAAWAIAGMAVAVVTFRWEPHRPTQRRPARPARQTSPTDPGAGSNFGDSSASTATTPTSMSFGATTPSHA